jgi:hypothetical protein
MLIYLAISAYLFTSIYIISNRLKYLYENDANFPSIGVPNTWDIEAVKADFAKVFHRGFITVACGISNKQDNEKWLILFTIAVHHDVGTRDGIYVKIETKFVTKTQIVKERGKEIIQYVDREIVKFDTKFLPGGECEIPKEFIQMHNKAAEAPK